MRGAKVVFCRERNKYVKIQIFWGYYECISYLKFQIEAGSNKKKQLKLFILLVI